MCNWKSELVFITILFTISASSNEVYDIKEIILPESDLNLEAESKVFSLPKCCPPGQVLDSQLERCVIAVTSASTPFAAEWLGPSRSGGRGDGNDELPNAGCDTNDLLRLSAADVVQRVQFLSDGSLRVSVNGTPGQQVHLFREEFCADASSGKESPWAMLLCPCSHVVCVRKCCPRGHILRVKEMTEKTVVAKCEESNKLEWMPFINGTYVILWGAWPTTCQQGLTRLPASWEHDPPSEDDVKKQSNMSVYTYDLEPIPINDVCVDVERNIYGLLSESSLHCASSEVANAGDITVAAITSSGAIALLLVILTLILLPEQRSSTFGQMIVCYASSLLLSFIFSIWMIVTPDMSEGMCLFIFTAVQYFDLATAFWLNAMCWDMGLGFRVFQIARFRFARTGKERFFKYSIFAWSGPIIISLVMVIMQLSLPTGHHMRPIEWYMGCQYKTSTAQFAFFYGPMLIILLTNSILLIYITWKIRKLQENIAILSKSLNYGTAEKTLLTFMRLLWSVGVVEAFVEISSWMIATPIQHFHVSMAAILSRAFCLFAMVCYKDRVLEKIGKLLPCRSRSSSGTHRLDNNKTPTISDTNNTFSSVLRPDPNTSSQ